ncbi:unnamed protein product [Gongylonema pulchrum]|uniref:Uncharacterized protein n=1 Tax=Gongylonema pulchrum TaxID=637853 RepID=A0A183DQL5_9BILA|nr:unnamed protein product [Gongylonema pulchrum]
MRPCDAKPFIPTDAFFSCTLEEAKARRKFHNVADVLKVRKRRVVDGNDVLNAKGAEDRALAGTDRAVERQMLGVSFRDHINNQILRQMSGVQDIMRPREKVKFNGQGRVIGPCMVFDYSSGRQ